MIKFRNKPMLAEDEVHIRDHQSSIRRIAYALSSEDPQEATIIKEIVEMSDALAFRIDDLLQMKSKTEEQEITAQS